MTQVLPECKAASPRWSSVRRYAGRLGLMLGVMAGPAWAELRVLFPQLTLSATLGVAAVF